MSNNSDNDNNGNMHSLRWCNKNFPLGRISLYARDWLAGHVNCKETTQGRFEGDRIIFCPTMGIYMC